MQMYPALALWALAAVVVPSCEAALSHRSGLKAHSSIRRTGLRRQVKLPLSDNVDAALLAQSVHSKFGPGNCMNTWRNEDGHCEVETKCKDHDISKYAVKFICMDDGGEKVRHVFAPGSFDADEQFDTLIECKKCLAEKEETIQIIEDVPAGSHSPMSNKTKEDEKEEDPGGEPLEALRDEVKQLETFMWSTSDALQKLNAKVYNDSFVPPKDKKPCVDCNKVGEKAAAKAVKAASSLVHHTSSHHREVGEPLRVDAEAAQVTEEHRRELAEEDGDDVPPRKALKVAVSKLSSVASSLAGAVRSAEVNDDAAPAQQPAKAQMVLRAAAKQVKKSNKSHQSLVVHLPKAEQQDDDAEDKIEDEEEEKDEEDEELENQAIEGPSLSALQKGGDDSEDDEATEDADEEEADDADGAEDASE